MERWPNFFIVGASHTGTSSLYQYLKNIPGIYMSPLKEPGYFSHKPIPPHQQWSIIRDKNKYLSLFKKVKDEKIIGEASPHYFIDPESPTLIHQVSPHARILISLRDPINRAYSGYLLRVRNRGINSSFHEEIQTELNHRIDDDTPYLQPELPPYTESVKRYLDIFGPEQVKIIIFEEWIQNAKSTVEEILRFLGLNHSITNFDDTPYNAFYGFPRPYTRFMYQNRRAVRVASKILFPQGRKFLKEKILLKKQPKPKMNEVNRKILVKFYCNDVRKLETFLERKLPWPNFQN